MSKADIIVEKALSLKGSHEYDNYCQRFVRVCYEAAGIYASASSAAEACSKWKISENMNNVPRGAAVYFKGTGSYGHVGIATGNGNVVHAANGVRVQSLEYCDKRYVFIGWGWHGGSNPDGKTSSSSAASSTSSGTKKTATVKRDIEEVRHIPLSGYEDALRGTIDSALTDERGYELLVENDRVYMPAVAGTLTLDYRRSLAPTALHFKALKDNVLDFREGSPLRLRIGGRDIFRGYVFEKSRSERDIISVTAYDSLRYFKNKDTLLYKNKKYSELLSMIIGDCHLKAGDIADTGYVIAKQLEEGTYFDILANAADITYTATGRQYVLLDDFGSICLRKQEDMSTGIVLEGNVIGSFDYTSTIDREVYNYVLAAYNNTSKGVREVYSLSDSNTALWGRLQYYLKLKEEMNSAQLKSAMEQYLKQYSRKRRYLTLKEVKGDINVRGGSLVRVSLDLGDIIINEDMICERAIHSFYGREHLMELYLSGREGEFDV